jgi:hypothetical protein
MTKLEILEWLDGEIEGYPKRATGNECADYVVRLAGRLVDSDRGELVTAMREWIIQHGKRSLLAVRIAAECKLLELKPDIERLLEDVRTGKAFQPYYQEFLVSALKRMGAAPSEQ